MCRLSSYDIRPPGCYAYEQTDGIKQSFPPQPTPEAQAQNLSSFRRGNGLSRSSVRECLEDVDHYAAQVTLHCNRRWTVPIDATNTTATALSQTSPIITPCKSCGAEIK